MRVVLPGVCVCGLETSAVRHLRIDLGCCAPENKWLIVKDSLRPEPCITFGNVLVCHSDTIVSAVCVKLEVHSLLFATVYSVYFQLPSLSVGCLLISR
jgi:hypothetical protein